MTLADLTGPQIVHILRHSYTLKQVSHPWLLPQQQQLSKKLRMPSQSLFSKSIALIFSKRSTRTRVSAETAAVLLGGRALFLGREDIQLGVNESVRDSSRVIGGMCQGIFARVGDHSEIEVRTHSLFFPSTLQIYYFHRNTLQSLYSTPSPRFGTRPKFSQTCSLCTNMLISSDLIHHLPMCSLKNPSGLPRNKALCQACVR